MITFTDSGCRLPLEIVDLVIGYLADDDDTLSLTRCTRVCLAFAAVCQRYLFHSISLSDSVTIWHPPSTLTRQFKAVLDKNPRLARHVRCVSYINKPNCRSTVSVLRRLRYVHTFTLKFKDGCDDSQQDWDTMLPMLRASVCYFIQSNNIVDLHLRGIANIPLDIFFHFPHLKILTLSNVSISDDGPAPITFKKPRSNIRLASLHIRGCLPGIQKLLDAAYNESEWLLDLKHLKDFSITVDGREMPAIGSILASSDCLESIYVHGLDVDWLGHLAPNLTSGSLQTLKTIQMTVVIEFEDDPYKHLIHELALISGRNVLEKVDLILNVETNGRCTTDMDSWAQLDALFSQKDAFPCLRYVEVLVITHSYSCDYTQLHERLDEIAMVGFPLLMSKRSEVDFSFNVEGNEVI